MRETRDQGGAFPTGDWDQGKSLLSTRWGNSLYWTFRRAINDRGVCGTSHCPDADADYTAVVVASEPITNEEWIEIPEGVVFGADSTVLSMSRSLIGTSFPEVSAIS